MCSSDFATVTAEMPIFSAATGIARIGLRCRCSKTRTGFDLEENSRIINCVGGRRWVTIHCSRLSLMILLAAGFSPNGLGQQEDSRGVETLVL